LSADELLPSNEIASIDEVVALDEIANAYTSCWGMLKNSPAAYTKIALIQLRFQFPLYSRT
jgi:hypothetical protein